MTGLLVLVLAFSLAGCETYKQVKQLVQDVLTVPEKVVQDGKDGATAVKDAVTPAPTTEPVK